jgi:hypothetical protein
VAGSGGGGGGGVVSVVTRWCGRGGQVGVDTVGRTALTWLG